MTDNRSEDRRPGIFLSHTWGDKPFVRKLAHDLRDAGVKVWLDEAEIKLGDSLLEKIQEGINSMDYLAVVLSPDSVSSEWVKREVEVAMNHEISGRRVKVLPLLYKKCDLPGFLIGKLYADFTDPKRYQASLKMILERLQLNGSGLPDVSRSFSSTREEFAESLSFAKNEVSDEIVEIHGTEITFSRHRGTVVKFEKKLTGLTGLTIKADQDLAELSFLYTGTDIARGDQIELLFGASLRTSEPIPLFLFNRTTGASCDLAKMPLAVYKFGIVESHFQLSSILVIALGFILSMASLSYLKDAYDLPSDTVSVLLVIGPLIVSSGVGLYLAMKKQREIVSARSELEKQFTRITSSFWN